MADVDVLKPVKQQRAGAQQLILGMAATHKRVQAAADDVAAAAVQAAAGVAAAQAAAIGEAVTPAAVTPAE